MKEKVHFSSIDIGTYNRIRILCRTIRLRVRVRVRVAYIYDSLIFTRVPIRARYNLYYVNLGIDYIDLYS